MLFLNGKYNTAKIFADNVDTETISQLLTLLNQEFISESKIRIMPDTHAGAGCVIGTTMTITDKIIPNLVGVDIGCGMYVLKLEEREISFEKLDKVIREHVPSGMNIRERALTKDIDIDKIIADVDINRGYRSLGTLGGGNHFIEIDSDDSGSLYLVIHTGSRHLGLEVAKHYQDIAWKKLRTAHIDTKVKSTIEKLKAEGKERDIENTIKILRMQEGPIPKDLCYVEEGDFENYIHDMEITQRFAKLNRELIAEQIVSLMDFHIESSFQTIHNYIDIENMILRKGSVSAREGETLIIPMNMRDGSLLCVGKGNSDWNYSAPHGAGRILSRSQARSRLTMDEYQESMKDIYTTCVSKETIDESPMAYKPMQEIIDQIQDTVEITNIIKPKYNFKAN